MKIIRQNTLPTLLTLGLTVLIIGGVYAYTKINSDREVRDSSELSNQQTYHSEQSGLEFEYPTDWFVREEVTAHNNRIYIENKKIQRAEATKTSPPEDYLMMWIDYRKPSTDTFSYEEQISTLNEKSGIKNIIENGDITINTYEFSYNPKGERSGVGPYLEAVWKDDQWIYNAVTMDSIYRESNVEQVNTLKQILSTIKTQR